MSISAKFVTECHVLAARAFVLRWQTGRLLPTEPVHSCPSLMRRKAMLESLAVAHDNSGRR
ncbi:hypothetical protein XAC3810_510087 [Xanthomonas citri pv. citri]|uniref:Uncharacterized protein n=1 Tax=Xanthomonas citri pv. citri TaxID=611301 RepID=A0A0U5FFW6_XANCI|nr:hypothetical protein XAC9322_520084 [Xanthomonas citri pv. citri]CEE30525.1 hypothetical protein XAC3824_660085 [Xanthomonas citri pv. citri]CEE31896.1 hypothetical protein XAC1083_510085 [Xanthomonas citri pv. citri]CEE41254.1 hypothetical protein XAC3810_510087 [Xanthomonas citri pv. citri]CEE43329.1 hypothetical protein XAC902_680085 [Xanthomonas citri pv. citri]